MQGYYAHSGLLLLLLVLHELLSRLEVLQCDALGGAAGGAHQLGVGFPLGLALFIPARRHERPG